MKSIYIFSCLIIFSTLSCKSAKSDATDAQVLALEHLVKNKNFTIESDWAYPQVSNAMMQVYNSGMLQQGNTAGSISLVGNANFLTISGDNITSYLPYFGERQMNVEYGGTDSAIQLTGLLEDCTVTKGKKNSITIKFKAKSKRERFQTQIKLYPNLNSEIQIIGTTRFPISYSGRVKAHNN